MKSKNKLLQEAYKLGFMASGEGWNGDWPFTRLDPESHADTRKVEWWRDKRKIDLKKLKVQQ